MASTYRGRIEGRQGLPEGEREHWSGVRERSAPESASPPRQCKKSPRPMGGTIRTGLRSLSLLDSCILNLSRSSPKAVWICWLSAIVSSLLLSPSFSYLSAHTSRILHLVSTSRATHLASDDCPRIVGRLWQTAADFNRLQGYLSALSARLPHPNTLAQLERKPASAPYYGSYLAIVFLPATAVASIACHGEYIRSSPTARRSIRRSRK